MSHLQVIKEQMRVSQVEDHLLHPQTQRDSHGRVLREGEDYSTVKTNCVLHPHCERYYFLLSKIKKKKTLQVLNISYFCLLPKFTPRPGYAPLITAHADRQVALALSINILHSWWGVRGRLRETLRNVYLVCEWFVCVRVCVWGSAAWPASPGLSCKNHHLR